MDFNKRSKERGVSLIELMVVVTIMGILATIAVPSYRGYQEKAQQKEAETLLSSYFIAAQAAKVEHGFFAGDFEAIGFNPVGKLNYRVRSGNGTDPANGPFKDECITTKIAPSDGNCRNAWVLWEEASQGSANIIGPIDSSSPPVITDSSFETYAARKLSLSNSQIDEWGINQRKKLVNTKDGLSSGGPHNNQSF